MQTLPLGLSTFLSYLENTTAALYAFSVLVWCAVRDRIARWRRTAPRVRLKMRRPKRRCDKRKPGHLRE